jgi:hypothetical protein
MEADVDRVRTRIRRGGDLGDVRQVMADFQNKWLPDDR